MFLSPSIGLTQLRKPSDLADRLVEIIVTALVVVVAHNTSSYPWVNLVKLVR